jgi:hypothetical protein
MFSNPELGIFGGNIVNLETGRGLQVENEGSSVEKFEKVWKAGTSKVVAPTCVG